MPWALVLMWPVLAWPVPLRACTAGGREDASGMLLYLMSSGIFSSVLVFLLRAGLLLIPLTIKVCEATECGSGNTSSWSVTFIQGLPGPIAVGSAVCLSSLFRDLSSSG